MDTVTVALLGLALAMSVICSQTQEQHRTIDICKWTTDHQRYNICSNVLKCETDRILSVEQVDSDKTLCNGSNHCPECCKADLNTDPTLTGIIQHLCTNRHHCTIDSNVVAGQARIHYNCQRPVPSNNESTDKTDMRLIVGVPATIGAACLILVICLVRKRMVCTREDTETNNTQDVQDVENVREHTKPDTGTSQTTHAKHYENVAEVISAEHLYSCIKDID